MQKTTFISNDRFIAPKKDRKAKKPTEGQSPADKAAEEKKEAEKE